MSEQNLNSNALITAETAQSIMDVWGSYKTHRPFKAYALHEVTFTCSTSGTETFVCEDYIIKDKLATFTNVRSKVQYNPNEGMKTVRRVSFYDSKKYVPKYDNLYWTCRESIKFVNEFGVDGYKINGDKTINADRIISINSLEIVGDGWYNLTKEQATERANNALLEHNAKMRELNEYQMSEENMKEIISGLELLSLSELNREAEREWEIKINKYKVKWIGKLLNKKPVDVTTPYITESFRKTYLKAFEACGFTSFDGVDSKYIYQYLASTQPKNAVEDVEYTEVV